MTRRLFNRLDTGPRRTEHHGILAFSLGHEQITVDIVAPAHTLELHQVAVDLLIGILRHRSQGVGHRATRRLVHSLFPERVKVGRHLGVRLYLLRREAHFHMVTVGLPVDLGRQPAVAEAGRFHRAHVDDGASVFQGDRAFLVSRQQFAAQFIVHHTIPRDAILIELDLDFGFLTGLVEPIGVVRHGDPQHITSIRIILGLQARDGTKGEADKHHPQFFHLAHSFNIWLNGSILHQPAISPCIPSENIP